MPCRSATATAHPSEFRQRIDWDSQFIALDGDVGFGQVVAAVEVELDVGVASVRGGSAVAGTTTSPLHVVRRVGLSVGPVPRR